MQSEIIPGTLYIVATPIGNLADLSPRAQSILQGVDCIAAEDTRHTRHLLQHFQINTRLIALHEHNEIARATELIEQLQQGKTIALVSDAGTPLISDPGFHLLQRAHQHGIAVRAIPGPCAMIAALSIAGISCARFCFEGFLPAKTGARERVLLNLLSEERTLIFYEAPHRLMDSITTMMTVFGSDRMAALVKELTKTFETARCGSLLELYNWLQVDPVHCKGEFVIIVAGALPQTHTLLSTAQRAHLAELLKHVSCKQAVQMMTQLTGLNKNALYQVALELQNT